LCQEKNLATLHGLDRQFILASIGSRKLFRCRNQLGTARGKLGGKILTFFQPERNCLPFQKAPPQKKSGQKSQFWRMIFFLKFSKSDFYKLLIIE
jgi:hypothetical protein